MIEENIEKFITETLQGLWPDWSPTVEEDRLWKNTLRFCDYEKSVIAIRNWFASQEKQTRRPPFGKLRQALRKVYQQTHRFKNTEPVLLYTIIREIGKGRGQRFCVGGEGKVPQSPEFIHEDAERMRESFNGMYGGNHIIVYAGAERAKQ